MIRLLLVEDDQTIAKIIIYTLDRVLNTPLFTRKPAAKPSPPPAASSTSF